MRIDDRGVHSERFAPSRAKALCVFEFVYLARADSRLERQHRAPGAPGWAGASPPRRPPTPTWSSPFPTRGTARRAGLPEASGIPYGEGLMKNRYVGRTFIEPLADAAGARREAQAQSDPEARWMANAGGRRGLDRARDHDQRQVVQALREAGATEVHARIACPPIKWPCFYGIDMSTRPELVASDLSVEEIRAFIGADSLGYLSLEADRDRADPASAQGRLLPRVLRRRVPDPDPRAGREVPLEGRSSLCAPSEPAGAMSDAYARSGVDLEAGRPRPGPDDRRRGRGEATDGPRGARGRRRVRGLCGRPGTWAGPASQRPVLAAATDGVGTKLGSPGRRSGTTPSASTWSRCASTTSSCTGAEPLFFLDYLAAGRRRSRRGGARSSTGVAEGCRAPAAPCSAARRPSIPA